MLASVFFFTDTATTEIYPLSLHDALPISAFRTLERRLHPSTTAYAVVGKDLARRFERIGVPRTKLHVVRSGVRLDRKSTRLNSSHTVISYAVFCLKKKKCTD